MNGPEKKPTNPGAGESYEVKGLTPEQQKKQIATMKKFGLKSDYEAKSPKAKKGQEVVKKLKKGTKEYKDRLALLTDIKIDKKNDRLSKVKIAGAGMTQEEIAGRPTQKAPEKKVAKKTAKKPPEQG